MNLDISNKVALITGGSEGIGLATARVLAAEGARVVLAARREATLRSAAREIEALGGHPPVIVSADMATAEAPARAVQAAIDGLIDQTRSIERAVALLELDEIAIEGSDSLDSPDAVFQ